MSSIFGGGTSRASRESQAAQSADNAQRQQFLEQQSGLARTDANRLFNQSNTDRNLGLQGALDFIASGFAPQVDAFQQGNIGAQQTLGQGQQNFQNAILGRPVQPFTPQRVNVDTSFLQNLSLPQFQQNQPQQPQQFDLAGILQNLRGSF